MAFDSLSEKLQNVFKNLRSKGRLTEDDVKQALKEVKMALLEADVNFKVVKGFVKDVQERAIGQDVMNGLNPGQMVIKIVNEELIKLMGSETTEIKLQPGQATTVIPIFSGMGDVLGLSQQTIVQTFNFGDAITNVVTPLSGTLMASIGFAGISLDRWLKFVWKWVVTAVLTGAVFVVIGVAIGYGPF